MESFLKKIISSNADENAHGYFVRFGKGNYARRFLVSVDKTSSKIKIKTSFELANELVMIASEIGGGKAFGTVLSKKDISDLMSKSKISGNSEEKRGGLFYKNNIENQELSSEQINELVNNSYFALLNIEGKDFILKIKQSLPKPGKDEQKIDDKFCVMELDLKYMSSVKSTFLWDAPECKKTKIENDVLIDEIEMPKDEKDPVKIRELARRKGKIVRRINSDGNVVSKEYVLNA